MRVKRTITIPKNVDAATKILIKKHGVNISRECEAIIRKLATDFNVKIK